jgi:hypothetical protein
MLHELVLAAQSQPEAAGFILSGADGIFVAIGGIMAAIVCGVIAAMKGRIRSAGGFSACSFPSRR